MRVFVLFAAVIALLSPILSVAEQSPTLDQIRSTGKMRIGFRASEPPMSFLDKDRKPVGYSIDLCTRIATAVKQELKLAELGVQFVPVTSKTRFSALQSNEIDILCGATTKTLSRSELVDFTQLTFLTGASLLSLKRQAVQGIPDLQGKKVAVVKDTTTIEVLKAAIKKTLTDAEVVPVSSAAEGLKALHDGKVQAFSSDQVVLIGLVLTSPDPSQYKVGAGLFSFEPFALAVRRNDADFRLIANRVLSHLYRSGPDRGHLRQMVWRIL